MSKQLETIRSSSEKKKEFLSIQLAKRLASNVSIKMGCLCMRQIKLDNVSKF